MERQWERETEEEWEIIKKWIKNNKERIFKWSVIYYNDRFEIVNVKFVRSLDENALRRMSRQNEINWLLSREWVWEMRKRVVSEPSRKIPYIELPKMLILFTKEP